MFYLFFALMTVAVLSQANGTTTSFGSPSTRASALLAIMNLTDKIAMLHGYASPGYTGLMEGNARLNIPALKLNDGRQGFRPNDGNSGQTAFPCELAAVATWDTSLMYAFGNALGQEFADKGANVVLAPMLILARVPQGGRNFESIGEDPELAYAMAFAHISGVQSVPGIIANADDFVLNNQETDRGDISSIADERTLFELYYRGYKGAIDAGVGSVMCSYNRVNGTHACENNVTLGLHLKGETYLNFTGWVLSDWGGVHSTNASAFGGLDMEMPGSEYFGLALEAAVTSGAVPMTLIDDKVLRILTPMFAQGVFDVPASGSPDTNATSESHSTLARTLAAAGTVVLTNNNDILPLQSTLTNIIVVGVAAQDTPYCCGAGSGGLSPPYVITPLQGIIERAGPNVNVTYIPTLPGVNNISTWYSQSRGDHFLDFNCDECYDLYTFEGSEGFVSSDPCVIDAFDCVELQLWWNGVAQSNLVIAKDSTWQPPVGYLLVRTLAYVLPLSYVGNESTSVLELWSGLDTPTGAPLNSHVDFWTLASNASRVKALAANYTKILDIGRVFTSFVPSPIPIPVVVNGVVIIVVSTPSSEGVDRTNLNLSTSDDALITSFTNSNPTNTIVVMNNPGAVVMGPWVKTAAAILAQWFPGQEMGHALADILWGDVNPSGRLPLTFPASNTDTPLSTPEQYPGVNGTVNYTEKLLIGYRWWDSMKVVPLFCFGHGLSYTKFTYESLVIDAISQLPNVIVTFTVSNTGQRAGREIPQMYIEFPITTGEPLSQLRGFTSLFTDVNETNNVTFILTPRDLSIWDSDLHAWKLVKDIFQVNIGASSRDTRLTGTFDISE